MARYLIDANLPRYFSLWSTGDFEFAHDMGPGVTDQQIWEQAGRHGLTIVTKDADFTDRILVSETGPKVIHLRIGNMRMRDLHSFLVRNWPGLTTLSASHRLVVVFLDRVECMS